MNFSQTSRLNDDILYYIFTLSTYRTQWQERIQPNGGYGDIPLTIIRRSSQVCVQWRRLLLQAKKIWGSCIDIDALGKQEWMEEVLRRAGDTLLTVRCGHNDELYPGDNFVETLLDRLWPRIRELEIKQATSYSVKVIEILERPTETMESFTVDNHGYSRRDNRTRIQGHTPSLFSGHAPNLVSIHLPEDMEFEPGPIWVSPSFFTNNIRHIYMMIDDTITPSELLSACARMSRLETLHVQINTSEDDAEDVATNQQDIIIMPYLCSLTIFPLGFDVYPLFLSRIRPAPGCTLHMEHIVEDGSECHCDSYVKSMKQVYTTFSESLFTTPRTENTDLVTMSLGTTMYVYAYADQISIEVRYSEESQAEEYYPAIIDTFLAIKMPSANIDLLLNMEAYRSVNRIDIAMEEEDLPEVESSIRHLLESMSWATILCIPHDDLRLLVSGKIKTPNCFPYLQHLHLTECDGDVYYAGVVLPFVLGRDTLITVNIPRVVSTSVDYFVEFGLDRLPPTLEFIWEDNYRFSAARGLWVP